MPLTYPQDTEEFQQERKSYKLLFNKLDTDVWAFNGTDNNDHGVDYCFEYIEDKLYKGYRVCSQIKSTARINIKKKTVKYDLKVKTASYAITCAQPFVLFVADLVAETVYYLCLQDYFINNPSEIEKLRKNTSTIRVRIPASQIVEGNCIELQNIAKSQYSFDGEILKKTR